ncbi:MAG: phosphatidylserine decarboxylase family protein [Sedimentisphaerales bacterium]|nr:phosphatidylserine decarboxylase family protein [Sedimentisphaerales bacterium]
MTKYGWPQVAVYPILIAGAMVVYAAIALRYFPAWAKGTPWALPIFWLVELVLLAVLVWALMFFRDPSREVPQDDALLMAPADGKVTDVETMDENEFTGGPALRIGIFLSIFNVHLNRAPCRATVETITYRKGKYLNAMNPLSGRVNESNTLTLIRASEPKDRLAVRQVSGAIARRIVCAAREGQELARGEKFGMIKFGSRTELYVPVNEKMECLVRIRDNVRAGVTPLVRYERCHD